jgi:hypothetical protein
MSFRDLSPAAARSALGVSVCSRSRTANGRLPWAQLASISQNGFRCRPACMLPGSRHRWRSCGPRLFPHADGTPRPGTLLRPEFAQTLRTATGGAMRLPWRHCAGHGQRFAAIRSIGSAE